MNTPSTAVISTVPAANALRRAEGFNPMKFLRPTISEKTGEKVLKLDLPYKRLWFRLTYPNGKMLLKPVRLTDQLAVFEAMVYAEKEDTEPLARFSSSASAAENSNYVQAAQDAALNEALENAGFGIQLCDFVVMAHSTTYGSEIPVSQLQATDNTAAPEQIAQQPVRVETRQASVQSEPQKEATRQAAPKRAPVLKTPAPTAELTAEPVSAPVTEPTQEVSPEPEPAVSAAPAEKPVHNSTASALDLLSESIPAHVAEDTPAEQRVAEKDTAPAYTPDMSVDEIRARMSIEDARAVTVDSGMCKGWTLAQVAEQRAPVLRYYMFAEKSSNILKAAASLVLQEIELPKAG